MRSPKSRTSKPMHIQLRKDARTAIYRAVFGEQDATMRQPGEINIRRGVKRSNIPWQDTSRRRPQDWSQQSAWGAFEAYKTDAALPREALIEIASALGVTLQEVL